MTKPNEVERLCKHHGQTTYILEGSGYYRCKKCRSANVTKRRKKVKEQLICHFGGKCRVCGYDACVAALEFHHVDGEDKEFGVAANGVSLSFERLKAEASKCVLLCCRCHREVHAGLIECPEIFVLTDEQQKAYK